MPLIFHLLPLGLMPSQIRSDTIAGAMIWSLAKMGEDIDGLLEDKTLRVSSGMPYFSWGEHKTYFGPKPPLPTSEAADLESLRKRKELKKAQYVEVQILNRILRGEIGIDDLWNGIGSDYRLREGLVLGRETLQSIKEYEGVERHIAIRGSERYRNEINRLSSKAESFFASHGYLYGNAGLYFMLEGSSKWKDSAKKAVRFLEDRGIGGEVSIGYGQFKFYGAQEGSPFVDDAKSEGVMTLSLYLPEKQEWEEACKKKEKMYYSLVRRAGMRSDGTPKKEAFFIGEGSVIPLKSAVGRDIDLTKNPRSVAWGHPYLVSMDLGNVP